MPGGIGLGLPEMEPAVTKHPVSVLLLGSRYIGKSTVLERFLRGQFGYPPPTSGVDIRFHTIRLAKSKRRVVTQLMDTSGPHGHMVQEYLARCDAVCYMYDVTSSSSFESIRSLHKLVQEHAPPDINAILLSTKNDTPDVQRQAEGTALARSLGVEFYETCAATGLNVNAAFEAVIKAAATRLAVGQGDVASIEAVAAMPVEAGRRDAGASNSQPSGLSFVHEDQLFGPLHYACLYGGAGALKQLVLKKGAILDAVDSQGRTPLHVAALRSRIPCARLLITAGADPRIHDKLGRTPGDLAAQLGNEELKDMLSKAVDTALYTEAMAIAACSSKTCKVLILGPTGAGKTSLWRAIRGANRGGSDPQSLAPRTTVQRTCVFDSSVVMLSQLQQMDDEPGTITPSPRLRQPSIGASTTLAGDMPANAGSQASGYDYTCWGTICLISDFFSRRSGPFRWRADERLPGSPVSRDMYTEEDTGDVSIVSWDLSGQDVSGPLQRMMVESANVVVICFDLFKAQYGREETLRDLASIFLVLDTLLPPGITNQGRVHHSVILVGTFRDALPTAEEDKVMDEISLAISRRLRSFNTFGRIRVPPSSRIYYAVGLGNRSAGGMMTPSSSGRAGPQRQAEEVSALREAVCSSVVRSGALRRNRPTLWLRALEEMRSIPATHVQSSGQSPFRSAIPLEQARHVADRVNSEFTGRPMEDDMFDVMLRMLAELGEVMLLPTHLVVRPEKILKIYQRLMETCMSKRATSPARRRSHKAGKDALPAHLEPIVQHLRSTGVVEHAHLLELLSSVEDASTVDVVLQAMQKAGLLTRDADGLCFFPDAPLLLHEELYPFPVDSPSIYDELSGKVLCYCSFAQDAVPRGLLALLVLHGSRFRSVEMDGLRFQYRPWSRPILARDHAEIPLSGYTAALTVDHRRARISVAVSCQDGAYLTPNLEAQVGLLLYQMMEDVRKQHYARFRMDLQVVDDGRVYDFVKDVLLVHKASERRAAAAAASGIGVLPEEELEELEQTVSVPHGHFDFSAEALGGGGTMDLDNVVHWARVFTQMPTCTFRPMPSALIHGTIASASARSAQSKPWAVHLEGCLRLIEDEPSPSTTASSSSSSKALFLIPHTAANRRRSQTSAYAALRAQTQQVVSSSGEAVPDPGTVWRIEPCCGGFRVRAGEGAGDMRGWYLALSSRAQREKDQDVHAILTAEPARAMVWAAVPAPDGGEGFQLRVRWGSEWRYLTGGAKDPKHPDHRLVVVSTSNTTARWGLDIPAVSEVMNPYSMLSPLSSTGSLSGPNRFSLITPRGLDAKAVQGIVAELLKEIASAVEDRVMGLDPASPALDSSSAGPEASGPSASQRSALHNAKSLSFTDELSTTQQATGAGALAATQSAA